MTSKPIIVAIDGYSSTGKSSFAKRIAARYGFHYIDSGALYRAVTLLSMENGCTDDIPALLKLLQKFSIRFEFSSGRAETFINERNVEKEIRSMQVSDKVSLISADAGVRDYVNTRLRAMAEKVSVVTDGRDIGTSVFPDAPLKIFMTADEKVRAQRRLRQIIAGGGKETFDNVLENLRRRDFLDSTRSVSPLVQAPDAMVLDNTDMTMEEELALIDKVMKDRFDVLPLEGGGL